MCSGLPCEYIWKIYSITFSFLKAFSLHIIQGIRNRPTDCKDKAKLRQRLYELVHVFT